MTFSAQQISVVLGGCLVGSADAQVCDVSKIEEGGVGTLTFINDAKYLPYLSSTTASVVIINNDLREQASLIDTSATLIYVDNARAAMARLLSVVAQTMNPRRTGVEQPAWVADGVTIPSDAYIGAFTYIARDKAAYFDEAACRMLSCSGTRLNEFEFFNLLEKISKSPVEGQKHIYRFVNNNTTRYIKMNIYESSEEWLGFVQDYTRIFAERIDRRSFVDYDPVTRLPSYPSFSQTVRKLLPEVQSCCLATLYINGIEKLGSFLTVDSTNSCITSVAEALKSFAGDNVIMGSKSNYEIFALFRDCDKMQIYNLLNSMDDAVQTVMLQCELWTDNNDMDRRVTAYAERLSGYASDTYDMESREQDVLMVAEPTAEYGKKN